MKIVATDDFLATARLTKKQFAVMTFNQIVDRLIERDLCIECKVTPNSKDPKVNFHTKRRAGDLSQR